MTAERSRNPTMPDVLAGKIALVSGAARGIGRAIALKLAAEGCDVAVNYYNSADEAETLCAEIRALGRRAVAIQGSVGIPDSVDEIYRRIRQAFRPARHPGQQCGIGGPEADGRNDAEALALVHGNQRARAQSPHPARPAADARRRAHHRHVEPGRAARDARLRLHRRVQGRAGVARARARAGARAARHPRQRGQRGRRRHRRARLLPEPRRAARELRASARRPGRC